MRMGATVTGDMREMIRQDLAAGAFGATETVTELSGELKTTLRGQITAAGMGQRLANTWRAQVYPKGRASLGAAGLVFSKAPDIITAFSSGEPIVARKGIYLAIPTKQAGRGARGRRPTVAEIEAQGVKLTFVPERGAKPALLIAEDSVARGQKGHRALRAGKRLPGVVMFVLVRQVTLKRVLDVDGPARQAEAELPERFLARWRQQAGR